MNSSLIISTKRRRVVLSVPMPSDMAERTKRMAQIEGRSSSNYVRWLIDRDFQSRGRAANPDAGDNEQGIGHQV
jgi:hypothetical protein